MRKFINEFKAFINRGNVLDMAIGIVIGASFTKIVNTLVANILMPPLGVVLGGVDFSDLKVVIKKATDNTVAVTIDYGLFINTLIDFIIVAFSVFILIKLAGKVRKDAKKASENKTCPYCTMLVSRQATRCPYCISELVK